MVIGVPNGSIAASSLLSAFERRMQPWLVVCESYSCAFGSVSQARCAVLRSERTRRQIGPIRERRVLSEALGHELRPGGMTLVHISNACHSLKRRNKSG